MQMSMSMHACANAPSNHLLLSVLEPYKLYFRAATAAVVVHMLATRGLSKRTLSVAAIIVLTAASQDILALQNKGTLKQMLHSSQVQSVVQPLSQYGLLPKVLVVQQQQEAAPHIQQLRSVLSMACMLLPHAQLHTYLH